ncbi:MAG: hypothetical protein DBX55_02725 [Verrucomicrobia bacterium]|nr:MAG: hypothetical protein DBX55_02725 [Verrucomicrobiota bacterium]
MRFNPEFLRLFFSFIFFRKAPLKKGRVFLPQTTDPAICAQNEAAIPGDILRRHTAADLRRPQRLQLQIPLNRRFDRNFDRS